MAYQGTAILGLATASLAQLNSLVKRVNPTAVDVAPLYLELAPRLGLRGDLAYAQAIHETNYFRFTGVVKPEQNNYAGIGATGPGNPGHSFATPEEGVLAHLQHLYAYASTDPLPPGMPVADPRFHLVPRGSAPHIGDLNGKWAVPGTQYGQQIDRLLGEILTEPEPGEPYSITKAYISTRSPNRPGFCSGSQCWEGVEGIVTHRTASPSMNARAIRNYFATAPDGRSASAQFVLDDTEILLIIPVGELAFHTIGKNATHLGIETCEHNWGTPAWAETYNKLVWLCGYLVRKFNLPISAVTGHFWWDPVDRPYDPTHMGWDPSEGKATGLFEWNTFVTDVFQQTVKPPAPTVIPVEVIKWSQREACTEGMLIGSRTYVPIREYTQCLRPSATVRWIEDPTNGPKVEVDIPFQ